MIRSLTGDCRTILPQLDAQSVHCVVTSPPYFGLRDYGTATWQGGDVECSHVQNAETLERQNGRASTLVGTTDHQKQAAIARIKCKCGAVRIDSQIGLEPTPQAYVEQMVAVFREVRRVLRDDGTLWLNLGSSYFGGGGHSPNAPSSATSKSGKYGATGALIAGHTRGGGGTNASQSRQNGHVLAYDNDGKGLRDSTDPDFSYSDLCDGCLDDFLSHHGRIVGTDQRIGRELSPALPTNRGNEHSDSVAAHQGALPHGAQVSTIFESWRRQRGLCSRCDSRASDLSAVRSFSGGVRESARMSWLNYTTFKPKDMVPIPWMVAFALQSDGWYLRQDIIWSKPNPMPESVTDRCTKAHEYIFLMSKNARYHYDADAICQPVTQSTLDRLGQANLANQIGSDRVPGKTNGMMKAVYGGRNKHDGYGTRIHSGNEDTGSYLERGANKRSVWEIATQPYSEAHFATFPPALIEPCILAGCPKGGTVLDPFGGAGTTGMVADRLRRNAILIELNPQYASMASDRIRADAGMFAELTATANQ